MSTEIIKADDAPKYGLIVNGIYQSKSPVIMALQGTLLRDCTDKQIVSVLAPALDKCRFDLGFKLDDSPEGKKDNKLFVDTVLVDLRLFCPLMAITEIPPVIYNGSRAKYDEAGKVFVTPANTIRWFMTYMMDQARIEGRREIERAKQPQPIPPTPEEIEARLFELISNAYTEYKVDGKFEDYNNTVYDTIEKYRPMPFSDERKKEIAKRAKEFLIKQYSLPARNLHERNRNQAVLKALQSGNTAEVKSLVKIQAKKFALCEFFNDMAEVDEDILLWLKETV